MSFSLTQSWKKKLSSFMLPVQLLTLVAITALPSVPAAHALTTGQLAATAVGGQDEWTSSFSTKVSAISSDNITYIYADDTDDGQSFIFENAGIPMGSTVNSVTIHALARKANTSFGFDTSSTVKFRFISEKSGNQWNGSEVTLSNSYTSYSYPMSINPSTGAAWTASEVNGWTMRFGVERTNSSKFALVDHLYLVVDYTAAPEPGSLTVIKDVINDNGGTAEANDFTMNVTGTNVSDSSFDGSETGVVVTLDAGAYSVSESGGPAGYASSLSADCSGTIAAGESKTCTITNNDIQPTITVNKIVVNDDGGTAAAGDFPLFVDETSVTDEVSAGFDAGTYTVSETGNAAYDATFSGNCSATGSITLDIGENKTCTITNDDRPGTLTVVKAVVDGSETPKTAADFSLHITDSSSSQSSVSNGAVNEVIPGSYTVGEVADADFTATFDGNCDASGNVSVALGDTKVCTITNTAILVYLCHVPNGNPENLHTVQVRPSDVQGHLDNHSGDYLGECESSSSSSSVSSSSSSSSSSGNGKIAICFMHHANSNGHTLNLKPIPAFILLNLFPHSYAGACVESSSSSSSEENSSSSEEASSSSSEESSSSEASSSSSEDGSSSSAIACTEWASDVTSFTQGLRKDGSAVLAARSVATNMLGNPLTSPFKFVSLGFGGETVLELDGYALNQTGDDLLIYETTGGNRFTYPLEQAEVYGSTDGSTWTLLQTVTSQQGTAVDGDTYAIGVELGSMSYARFIKIKDTSNAALHTNDADGIEIAGVKVLHLSCDEPAALACEPADATLVGYWKLDEATGTDTEDSSGLNNDGEHAGEPVISSDTAPTVFVNTQSLQFDGSNDAVQVADDSSLDLSSYTVSAWVKPSASNLGSNDVIVSKGAAGYGSYNYLLYFSTANNNTVTAYNSGLTPAALNGTAIPANVWSHVAMTFDGTTRTIYVNGVAVASDTPTGTPAIGAGLLEIAASDGNLFNFPGLVDDVRVYDDALSSTELAAIAGGDCDASSVSSGSSSSAESSSSADNSSSSSSSSVASCTETVGGTGLIGYWPMDEGSGSSTDDASANGNMGTLENGLDTGWTSSTAPTNFLNPYALDFDGTDDFVTTASNSVYNVSDITIAGWVKADAMGGYKLILRRSRDGIGEQYSLYLNGDELEFWALDIGLPGGMLGTTNANLQANTWYHIAATFNSASNVAKLYINGAEAASVASVTGAFSISTQGLVLGGIAGNYYWNGQLDDMRLYSRVLSAEEMETLASGCGGATDGNGSSSSSNTSSSFSSSSESDSSSSVSISSEGSSSSGDSSSVSTTEFNFFTNLESNDTSARRGHRTNEYDGIFRFLRRLRGGVPLPGFGGNSSSLAPAGFGGGPVGSDGLTESQEDAICDLQKRFDRQDPPPSQSLIDWSLQQLSVLTGADIETMRDVLNDREFCRSR